MRQEAEFNHLTRVFILGFALIILSAFFWSVVEQEHLNQREDNPRRVLAELNTRRGTIFDRHGEILAYSEPLSDAIGMKRIYPYPEAVSATGYYSYQYGQTGLEEGFHLLLKGESRNGQSVYDDLLNRPIEGGDVRSTLDIRLQIALFEAMQQKVKSGAAIIAHVPSGEVLAMVSLPAYRPNQIEQMMKHLASQGAPVSDEELYNNHSPLLNRVIAETYQPGGALQTLLLAMLLETNAEISLKDTVPIPAIHLDTPSLMLPCTIKSETPVLPLDMAYLHGCPAPFVHAEGIRADSLETYLTQWFGYPALLNGYGSQESNLIIQPISAPDGDDLSAAIAGQGDLTVSPLQMLQGIVAVVNEGQGIPLHLGQATRAPDSDTWEAIPVSAKKRPVLMQPDTATIIREILETDFYDEADFPLYGHVSLAYSGQNQYVWFLGWTPIGEDESLALVILLEGKDIFPDSARELAISIISEQQTDTH